MKAITIEQFKKIPAEAFAGLTGVQLIKIPADILEAISAQQFKNLSNTALQVVKLNELPKSILAAITAHQLAQNPKILNRIGPKNIIYINSKAFSRLTENQLNELIKSNNKRTNTILKKLTLSQLLHINPQILKELDNNQISIIKNKIKYFNKENVLIKSTFFGFPAASILILLKKNPPLFILNRLGSLRKAIHT